MMEEYLPYYDWNTGTSLQPWAWLLEEEDEEWEFRTNSTFTDYQIDLMTMDSMTIESRKKSIPFNTRKSPKVVDKSVDKLCKNRKIVINKTK